MRLLHVLISIATISLIAPRYARAIPTDFEGWFTTTAIAALDERRRHLLYLEIQPRMGDDWQRMALLVVRPALVYSPHKDLGLFVGYAWVPKLYDQEYHRLYRDEQRLWEQALYKHSSLGVDWHHRLRQEQRIIADADGLSNRTRYLIRGSLPLEENGSLGITAYSETLVNLNGVRGGPAGGYEQTRFFIGPFWEAHNTRYEAGYLGEYDRKFGDGPRWVNAIAMLAAFSF
jgi:Protein of unknown function (DUF2490)